MGRESRGTRILLYLAFAFFLLVPLLFFYSGSLWQDGGLTLRGYAAAWPSPAQWRALGNSLRLGLAELGYGTYESTTPIVPVEMGSDQTAYLTTRALLAEGMLVTPVVYPAVPRGAAWLRLCATAGHSREDIDRALEAFGRVRHVYDDARAAHPV